MSDTTGLPAETLDFYEDQMAQAAREKNLSRRETLLR